MIFSAFGVFLSVFYAFFAYLRCYSNDSGNPKCAQHPAKALRLSSRSPQRRPGRCPRSHAAHSPFCPSGRKSAIWRKIRCESIGGAGALVGKAWEHADETRQVPGGVHGTPRRGIWTANSKVTFLNGTIENPNIPDCTPSFTITAVGG